MTERQWMPLMRTGLAVRMELLNDQQAKCNHSQGLDMLAGRGGLSPCEALAIADRRAWHRMDQGEAIKALEAIGSARLANDDPSSPNDLRAAGWSVAVHNDYKLADVAHTFWLMTKGNECRKGEGRTDAEALDQIRRQLVHCPHARTSWRADMSSGTCEDCGSKVSPAVAQDAGGVPTGAGQDAGG